MTWKLASTCLDNKLARSCQIFCNLKLSSRRFFLSLWFLICVLILVFNLKHVKVLTYAQQSRERSNYDQAALAERMQEYKRQIDRESRWSSNGAHGSPNGDGIQAIGRSSHKMIEAVMQSAAKGKVKPHLLYAAFLPFVIKICVVNSC